MSLLELNNITKNFGAVNALSSFCAKFSLGEVVGLMGDNGAGKSTLVKIIAGNFRPNQGEIFLNGEKIVLEGASAAKARGIEVVYQDLALCNNLDAASNVFLGREISKNFAGLRILDKPAMYTRSKGLFDKLKSDASPRQLVENMSGGQRQAVAIARTFLSDAKLVVLDEPTAAISVRQVAEVLDLIRQLRNHNVCVILVSHRMPDIFEVCDRIIVLRRGEKVADKAIKETSADEVTGLITGAIAKL